MRATTRDSRVNHLMIHVLHIHKDKTDAINPVDVANNFDEEKRKQEAVFLANVQRTMSP